MIRLNNIVMNRILIILISLIIASCASRGPTSDRGIYHTVTKGQTLWRISQAYKVSLKKVMKVNKIADASKIEQGQKLFIPGAKKFIDVTPASRWTHIVIHHSATFNGNAAIFDKQHRKRGFWNGLGYHFVIGNGSSQRRNGQVEIGHRWVNQMDGAHCNAMDMNKIGIGICLVGNFDEQKPSTDQINSLSSLVLQLRKQFGISSKNVIRHNQVQGKNTHCPGSNFPWGNFKDRVASASKGAARA